jgi:dolichyl-phosphate beta-glucosyltransferase
MSEGVAGVEVPRARPVEDAKPGVRRSLSVVIPAYNETARLPSTIRAIHQFLLDRNYDAEILVVDDGSRDATRSEVEQLRRALPLLRVLGYEKNRGKGFAVRTGVLGATREAVLFSDADLSTPIGEIDRLWPWFDAGYDVVIASRSRPSSDVRVHQPFYRENMGRVFNAIVSMLALRGIRDTQCGFKLFRRETAVGLFSKLKTNGFAFDVEILVRARDERKKIAEVGVHWVNSPDSRVHAVKDSARMLLELLRMRRLL